MDVARNHQSVNWAEYFNLISNECPWSTRAFREGLIDIRLWKPQVEMPALGHFEARIWLVTYSNTDITLLAEQLNNLSTQDEWLFSYPGYGEFATPIPILIQQDRQRLLDLRQKLQEKSQVI